VEERASVAEYPDAVAAFALRPVAATLPAATGMFDATSVRREDSSRVT